MKTAKRAADLERALAELERFIVLREKVTERSIGHIAADELVRLARERVKRYCLQENKE